MITVFIHQKTASEQDRRWRIVLLPVFVSTQTKNLKKKIVNIIFCLFDDFRINVKYLFVKLRQNVNYLANLQ